MPPAPPATKCAHALRSLGGDGRGDLEDVVEAGLEDGSTWPSSRDWELGAAKADATGVGEMVVLIWERVGGWIPVCWREGVVPSVEKVSSIICRLRACSFEMVDRRA